MNNQYLKDFIFDGGFISEDNITLIEDKMLENNLTFTEALIELELIEHETLKKIINLINGIPKINLADKTIPLETLILIPEPIARVKKIIPFKKSESSVSLAVLDNNIDIEFIKKIIPKNYEIEFFITDKNDLNKKINEYQKILHDEMLSKMINNLKNITKVKDFGYTDKKELPENFQSDIANNYYSEKFVQELLNYAHSIDASHIYINNGEKKNLISFRILGENYPIMEIEPDTLFSISIKLKKLADINIFSSKEIINNTSFKAELNGEIVNINLSFIKTFFGDSLTLELSTKDSFGTDFITYVKDQKEVLYRNLNSQQGFYVISGEEKSGKTKTTYSLLEYEASKNKEIYSLEDIILHRINYIEQILIDKKTKKELLLTKIVQNRPDMISIEYIKPYILSTLMNYVTTGGKVILGIKSDIEIFIDTLMRLDFKKGQIVKNFNILIEHKIFKKLNPDEKKEIVLNKKQIDILEMYISKNEILNLLKEENLVDKTIKKLDKIKFYSKTKNILKNTEENIYIRGVNDLGIILENLFIEKKDTEFIKKNVNKQIKRSVLENALILSFKGEIDINEIIKYLTTKK